MGTSLGKYRDLLIEDLEFHISKPYFVSKTTPVHRWYLIPESCSLEWAKYLLNESAPDINFVIDPFCGSGTVALQSKISQKKYIGGDILGDMVLATLLKMNWYKIPLSEFQKSSPKLLQQIYKLNFLPTMENSGLSKRVVTIELLTEIQDFIMNILESPFCKYAWLLSIYNSTRAIADENNFVVWFETLRTSIQNIEEDIIAQSAQYDIEGALFWGDSRFVNWKTLCTEIHINPIVDKGLLIVTPTFVNTSQRKDRLANICNLLSSKVLETVPEINIKKNYGNALSIINDYNDIPNEVQSYINCVANILQKFQNISVSDSIAIIENENPEVNGNVIETDLYICEVAKKLGFKPEKILVTHYVIDPGNISHSVRSLKRGSLIFLIRL